MSFVYVISDDEADALHPVDGVETVKIGFTSDSNIFNRIRQLQTGNPRQLRIIEIHEFKNNDMAKQIELLCHWNLASSRLNGEWFLYSGKVMDVLGSLRELSNYYPGDDLSGYFAKYPNAKAVDYVG